MAWVSEWWGSLNGLFEQILVCIAVPSTLILIIQAVLIVIGVGGDGAGDAGGDIGDLGDLGGDGGGGDGDGSGDFGVASLFTLQGIASFFCVFGWVAIAAYRTPMFPIAALVIGAVLGFLTMFALAKVMVYITKLAQSGTLDVKNLLGKTAVVYLKIPPKGEGKGKVTVQTSERLVEFDAVSEDEKEIPNNAQVRVIDILGENVLVVER